MFSLAFRPCSREHRVETAMCPDTLFAPVCSITTTRRRRFLWAAWWTGPPERSPFRKPDAYEGGARSAEEALQRAERAAGRPLVAIEPRWARAWARILVGQPAWPRPSEGEADGENAEPERGSSAPRPSRQPAPVSPFDVLGVHRTATLVEIKRAYRKRALDTHPDRGGTAEAFQRVVRAYESVLRRKKKPAKKPVS